MGKSISVIKIDGKPLEKLVEVIAKGIGTIYEPKQIRRVANAKAYELRVLERAKTLSKAENLEAEQDILDRLELRLLHRESIRQSNLDNITFGAAVDLQNEKSVSEELPDNDWIRTFFNYAEDVCDEDMQVIWSKILAGEVKQPKTFSLRTLQVLKSLSSQEAESFQNIASSCLEEVTHNKYNANCFIIRFHNPSDMEGFYGLKRNDLYNLIDAGLLSSQTDLNLQFISSQDSPAQANLLYGDRVYNIKANRVGISIMLPSYPLTVAGREIASIVERQDYSLIEDIFQWVLGKQQVSITHSLLPKNKWRIEQ